MNAFIILSALLAGVAAVPWKDCGSTAGVVKDVIVPTCMDPKICQLKRGTKVTFKIDFTSKEVANSVTSVVHGVIHGAALPFPLGQPDACKGCGLTCPLKPNNSYAYETSIDVKSIYPALQLVVKWELKDENKKDLVCIELPAQIV